MARARFSRMQQKAADNVVLMEKLSSKEFFLEDGADPKPVLGEIDLSIQKGQVWGINGKSLFEIKLLLEIMANIKPYRDGKCVLVEQGMMRLKRIILPHIFYVGSPGMVYNNMNVLEFLMFATAKSRVDKVEQQEQIFESLINIGLKNISLTPLNMLSKEQKAVIILIVGAYSGSQLIVFNFPDYDFDDVLLGAMAKTARFITSKEKTLVVGTKDSSLIEKACSHTAFLLDGRIFFQGTVKEFRLTYDKIMITIWDQKISEMAEALAAVLPQYQYDIRDKSLVVSNFGPEESNPKLVYEKVVEAGFAPEKVRINPKKVQNACEEIIKQYDLQKQLL